MIGIVIPSGDMVHADMMCSLVMNSIFLTRNNIPHMIINPKCSLVQKGRYIGVKQALEAGCSHVMFIDSDMTFPPYTIMQLWGHRLDVVGCYYPKRQEGGEIVGEGLGRDLVKYEGVQLADTLGTGMLLISTDVFNQIPEPWFHVHWTDNDTKYGDWMSEDEWFCNQITSKTGIKIWCDCDLSKQIGHIGSKTFGGE